MAPLLLVSARAALASSSSSSSSLVSSSSRHLLSSSPTSLSASSSTSSRRPYAVAAVAATNFLPKKDRPRVIKEKMYEDFQHDETTGQGHLMIQAEREALAFMRTVELELPKLKPIPFSPPDITTDYLRFHTQKTWPLETADPKESSVVTLTAPVVRLPFNTSAARHKFLLLTSPEYYHPFRPQAFDPYQYQRTTFAYRSPRSRVYDQGAPSAHLPPVVNKPTIPGHGKKKGTILHRAQVPRAGGWTPHGLKGAGANLEFDQRWETKLSDRQGEDLDGWVSIKCGLFPFQLQNKKWCEDTLRRLVNEANDPEDPMDDIPLDLSPYFLQWRQQRRRADGSRISARDIPNEWNLTREERAAMTGTSVDVQRSTEVGAGRGEAKEVSDEELSPNLR